MTTVMSGWDRDWNTTKLGGQTIPGVVTVKVKRPSSLEKKKAHGTKKAKHGDKGAQPKLVTITVRLVDEFELAEFEQTIQPLIDPPGKSAAQDPIAITNRACAVARVDAIVTADIEYDQPESGGFMEVTITAEEWQAKPVAVKKPKDKPKEESGGWDLDGQPLPPSQAPFTGQPNQTLAPSALPPEYRPGGVKF